MELMTTVGESCMAPSLFAFVLCHSLARDLAKASSTNMCVTLVARIVCHLNYRHKLLRSDDTIVCRRH